MLTVHVLTPEDRRTALSDDEREAVRWLHSSSRPVAALGEIASVRVLLDGLTMNLDG